MRTDKAAAQARPVTARPRIAPWPVHLEAVSMTHHADLTPAATAEAVAGLAPAIRNTRGQFADAVVAPWPHPTPITHFASRDEVGRGGPITHSYDGMSGKYFPVARATFIVPLLIPNNGHPRTPTRHGR